MVLAIVVLLACATAAWAQRGAMAQREPHVGYVYPAGGQQGTTFEVTVGGQFLDGASRAIVSGEGIRTTVLRHKKPPTPKEIAEIREIVDKARKELRETGTGGGMRGRRGGFEAIMKKAQELGADPEKLKAFDEFRRARMDPRRQLNQQLSETVTLQVEVAAAAEPGRRELRLVSKLGLSNPLAFCVGPWPEHAEQEPNNTTSDAEVPDLLPVVFNGQITPGDVDRFAFKARKGQRLVAVAQARELMPYLADAVPGWFQATLTLLDADGKEVAYADDFRFHPDPFIACVVPKTGRYTLEIKDAIYRGREDFVYRITVGEVPLVTDVFPLGARAGSDTSVALTGWNLPAKTLDFMAKDRQPSIRLISIGKGRHASNRVPVAVDTLAECVEQEPNDEPAVAQRIRPPLVVNGRIGQAGDCDVFRFHGRGGGRIVVEVVARRLGSPLDSVLELADAAGRRIAANDDHEDRGDGLSTHHADSRLLATLPRDGDYYVRLVDAQGHGGDEYAYRLRISARRPDFELRVVPSTINAPPGATVPITVHALRKDGFAGDVALALADPAEGFALAGGWVPAGQDQVRLTLTVPREPRDEPFKLHLEGRAAIGSRQVVRTATPADDMMQAFIYRHLVAADEWMVAVLPRPWRRPPLKVLGQQPVKLPSGATAEVAISAPRRLPVDQMQFVLNEPPEGIMIEKVSAARRELNLRLRTDAAKVKPGLKGNLIVDVFIERTVRGKNAKQAGQKRRIRLDTLPAISFEIVDSDGRTGSLARRDGGVEQ